jgi:hypothetical protein
MQYPLAHLMRSLALIAPITPCGSGAPRPTVACSTPARHRRRRQTASLLVF